ncbi:MAG TPA: DUF1707 domain-containing protein [Solirubrobacteraceae bacterium]
MAGRAALRAADADRDQVAERLRKAAGEGRLATHELEQRLEATFTARTYAQLDSIVADLPGRRLTRPGGSRPPVRARHVLLGAIAVAAMVAVILTVVFVATGVFAGWVLWLAVGWWFFGRHRRRLGPGRSGRACGGWHRGPTRPGGYWA